LSGNMIDLCPVGALTSKPFRYSARTWELSRRKSISPHDSTGSNLIAQVKGGRVMRVLPMENEAVNECWLADSDRFSYEGLNTDERLTTPMVKQGNRWQETDWTTALEYVANGLKQIVAEHGPQSIGALGTAHSTVEELHLLGKLVRRLGSDNIDHRLRHAASPEPVAADAGSVRWLGTSIASLSTLDRAFVIGSFLRKDHPLFAQRLRQATKRGAQITSLHALADDWLMPVAARVIAAPSEWVAALAGVAAAVAAGKRVPAPMESESSEEARAIAASLLGGQRKAVLLGNAAAQHPEAETLLALAGFIAEHTGATCGYLGEAANSVGAQLVGAQPLQGGLTAAQMLAEPLKAYVLLNAEPLLDAADPSQAAAALAGAQMVVAMTAFKTANFEHADVLLPIAPFTETSGTFVNAEGRVQSFHSVVKPRGEVRPAWKVLRVLGTMLGLEGFGFETSEEVKAQALGDEAGVAARLAGTPSSPSTREREPGGESPLSLSLSRLPERAGVRVDAGGVQTPREPVVLERIADVPIYSADAILRRSPPLQATADARPPRAGLPTVLWQRLGLAEGADVHVQQGSASVKLAAYHDASLAANCVRVPAGHPATAALGPMFGAIAVEKA
uniref:molybdopterin-dependent oxidoreductase n=1 Tax=Methylibium sp. TaxID=2067992 RepID=UPI0017C87D20